MCWEKSTFGCKSCISYCLSALKIHAVTFFEQGSVLIFCALIVYISFPGPGHERGLSTICQLL